MARSRNALKLGRTIPWAVKRQVRQRDKFGCVICRSAFFQYDHFDPEFKDAEVHSPDGICCLCPTCHSEVTAGRYSRDYVRKCSRALSEIDSAPVSPPLDFHDSPACLKIGGLQYDLLPLTLVEVYGETVLAVRPSVGTVPGSITGRFFSDAGVEVLQIRDNEIVFNDENWGVEVVGKSIIVRTEINKICLKIQLNPPQGIIVEKVDMKIKDCHVFANQHTFCVGKRVGDQDFVWFGAELRILENRFRGSIIRIDEPAKLAAEWNAQNHARAIPPKLCIYGKKHHLLFKTSGFPGIKNGFFYNNTPL